MLKDKLIYFPKQSLKEILNYLANGHKTQWAKNHINTSIEEPGINESGIEAKKRGF